MIYAFDFGNVLSNRPRLCVFANALMDAGHEVHVVTANPDLSVDMPACLRAVGVRYTSVRLCLDDFDPSAVARRKQEILRELHADVFFDDVEQNVDAAKAIGVRAILVGPDFILAEPMP